MLTLQTTHENAYTFPQTCFLQHDSAHILRNRAIQAVGLQPKSSFKQNQSVSMLRRFGCCHFGLLSIFYNSAAAVVNEFDDAVMRIDAGAKNAQIY